MYDDGPEESDLVEQIELDIRKAINKNVDALRDVVMDKCPQATVTAGDIEVKTPEYLSSRYGCSLTASVRCPVSVMLPSGDESLVDIVDTAVADLEPVGDRLGHLQGLEWMADWDDKSTLAYVLEGEYKKEDLI